MIVGVERSRWKKKAGETLAKTNYRQSQISAVWHPTAGIETYGQQVRCDVVTVHPFCFLAWGLLSLILRVIHPFHVKFLGHRDPFFAFTFVRRKFGFPVCWSHLNSRQRKKAPSQIRWWVNWSFCTDQCTGRCSIPKIGECSSCYNNCCIFRLLLFVAVYMAALDLQMLDFMRSRLPSLSLARYACFLCVLFFSSRFKRSSFLAVLVKQRPEAGCFPRQMRCHSGGLIWFWLIV